MAFPKALPPIDPAVEAAFLIDWVKNQILNVYKREGAVVGLSGGVDSAVSAAVSAKAVGREARGVCLNSFSLGKTA